MAEEVISDKGWRRNDTNDAIARQAFESVLHVSYTRWKLRRNDTNDAIARQAFESVLHVSYTRWK